MRRLQSRLIAAFLGVVILTMLPLSLIHYLSIDNWFNTHRNHSIELAQEQYIHDGNQKVSILEKHFLPAAQALKDTLNYSTERVKRLKESESYQDLKEEEEFIWEYYVTKMGYDRLMQPGNNVRVIPKKQYEEMQEWMGNSWLYEQDGTIYYYVLFALWTGKTQAEIETIGGLYVMLPLIQKTEDQHHYKITLSTDRRTRVIGSSPFLLQDVLTEEQYKQLYEQQEEIDVNSFSVKWLNDGEPVQGWMKPIINQNGDNAAIVIISEQIFDAWEMVGPTILNSVIFVSIIMIFLAVLISRSISKPMYELVGVANQMSQGDFSARIDVKGTTEQQVLRHTFNQLAIRITEQLDQLQQQTNKLEISNRELEETQKFLQNILVNVHTGVLSIDQDGTISLINEECRNILQIKDSEGVEYTKAIRSNVLAGIIEYSLRNCVCIYQQEIFYEQERGESLPLQVSTVPILQQGVFSGIVVTIHDLSALRKLEAEVRRHDRLVSLGRMAGGLAHEIRNPLGIIRGSAEILHKRFGGQDGEEGLSMFIMEEVIRLSRVLTDFLLFARPPVPAMETVSAQELIDCVLPYVQISDDYKIECTIASDSPMLYLDLELCKQVFLNLILNAQDAMEDGGTISIRVRPSRMDSVLIEVEDDGIGIPEDLIDRIFDPFVTSKDSGTGLGLSLVHQIVSSQNGKIEVENIKGKGCCFRIEFPVYRGTVRKVTQPEVGV